MNERRRFIKKRRRERYEVRDDVVPVTGIRVRDLIGAPAKAQLSWGKEMPRNE